MTDKVKGKKAHLWATRLILSHEATIQETQFQELEEDIKAQAYTIFQAQKMISG